MNYDVVALGEILIDFAQEKLDESVIRLICAALICDETFSEE